MADNKDGKRFVIKGTPYTDIFTGKPRMVIEEGKSPDLDLPAGFAFSLVSLLLCIYSIVRGNIIAILITALLTVGCFLYGVYSLSDGTYEDFKQGLLMCLMFLLFILCGLLMAAAAIGAVVLVFYLITLI